MGPKISAKGLKPTTEKVQAIIQAPQPTNVTQLKSVLGMLNYYGKFLPNLSTCLAPLYKLLQKQSHWKWGHEQKEAFRKAKDLLTSSSVLIHYDPTKPLVLACDVSPYSMDWELYYHINWGQMSNQLLLLLIPWLQQKELFTNRQRNLSYSVWCQAFSPILVWKKIYYQI